LRENFAVLVNNPADRSAKPGSHLQTSLALSVRGAFIDAFAVIVGALDRHWSQNSPVLGFSLVDS
jgi:hypothetical protein